MNKNKKYYPSVGKPVNPVDIYNYTNIKKQISDMQKFAFGVEINVMIMTDRLPDIAKGLQEYMQNSSDITVDFVSCLNEAKEIINNKHIDFFIIAGYLKNELNFNAVELVRKYNRYSTVIIYALLDPYITYFCRKYSIKAKYDRTKPIEGFIEYMRNCYSYKNNNFLKDNPADTTREQLRLNATHEEYFADQLREQERINAENNARINAKKKKFKDKFILFLFVAASTLMILVLSLFDISNSH
ncbi:MAG: hypothetical protein FWE27_07020 [Defluviitaleaceae bacterium]|nr:hypothetical protein [Defluviitaleaceae bacterium]